MGWNTLSEQYPERNCYHRIRYRYQQRCGRRGRSECILNVFEDHRFGCTIMSCLKKTQILLPIGHHFTTPLIRLTTIRAILPNVCRANKFNEFAHRRVRLSDKFRTSKRRDIDGFLFILYIRGVSSAYIRMANAHVRICTLGCIASLMHSIE